MPQGHNVKKLICHKMALLMIPSGAGFLEGLQALTTPGNVGKLAREATAWVEQAIAVVKSAPDNPYGNDDEAIAGEVLRQIEEKKRNTHSYLNKIDKDG
jgi:hypothetical protein